VRARLPLAWLALYRRRRMLVILAAGLFAFELLIVIVATTVPQEAIVGPRQELPDAFEAFSGSSGCVSLASYAGLLGPASCTRSGSPCS
jgi:beta-exotoxin I transport system permease protein